jgi:glutamate racemase
LKEEAVVFLDSGVGGLPYLSWIRERLKGEHWLYLADHQGFPYGDKEPEELISRLKKLIITVQRSLSIRLMVLACNTASVIALEALRGVFDFPIVGTVPAVKPAAKNSLNGSIAVLATEGTADAPYLRRLIQEHAQDKEVAIIGSNALVDSIEKQMGLRSTGEAYGSSCSHQTHSRGEEGRLPRPGVHPLSPHY